MNEKKRQRRRELGSIGGSGDFDAAPQLGGTVDVAHGPYRESLPVGEMSVADVRRRFQDQLDIHPDAVALVDGHEVGDATRLRAGQMLMFVRPAGEKGVQLPLVSLPKRVRRSRSTKPSPVVTIEDAVARVALPEGAAGSLPLPDLLRQLSAPFPDTRDVVLPDGVKAVRETANGFIVVHQLPPSVYGFRWIAPDSEVPYGAGARYRGVRLALPYVVTLAVFERARGQLPKLSHRNECFFLNEPLDRRGLETDLRYPALLNCSKFPPGETRPLAWICTQNLKVPEPAAPKTLDGSLRSGLTALLRHLLESAFNYSSEHHELNSWFSETVAAGVDPRLGSVEDWEQASAQDPLFVLEVPWLSTGHTLGATLERLAGRRRRRVQTAHDLARLILNASASSPQAGGR